MYGEKAIELIKELDRSQEFLQPYNNDLIKEVSREILQLLEQNQSDARASEENRQTGSVGPNLSYLSRIKVHHTVIQRNLRCLLAYHYNRLKNIRNMRWQFGSVLPLDVKNNLSHSETVWFMKYSNMLSKYMRSVGDEEGINLAVDLKPPKQLCVEVICLVDYGKFELSNGEVVLLKKNSRHFLPRSECEELITQGVFQHIIS